MASNRGVSLIFSLESMMLEASTSSSPSTPIICSAACCASSLLPAMRVRWKVPSPSLLGMRRAAFWSSALDRSRSTVLPWPLIAACTGCREQAGQGGGGSSSSRARGTSHSRIAH